MQWWQDVFDHGPHFGWKKPREPHVFLKRLKTEGWVQIFVDEIAGGEGRMMSCTAGKHRSTPSNKKCFNRLTYAMWRSTFGPQLHPAVRTIHKRDCVPRAACPAVACSAGRNRSAPRRPRGPHFAILRAASQFSFLDPRRAAFQDVAGRIWPAGRTLASSPLMY